jgi:hypothetical protein
VNKGILISPNYWLGSKKIKGMHGYNPKDKDMKGFYILKEEGLKKNINTLELHEIINKKLKLLNQNGRE